ncbi:hypothetical protein LS482_03090 [Sinomicrobium kalidii]|uniref:hypothetical protein n=1 Tax=Sinomicrobium kalidii TaxID=2900738 RepID=UPI001E65A212|nr:hypothetical protein [Sinomicrobium kalidii]UGU16864.1 hypothetical protein LS482_03090 [Sinomicrobium kalidii]
MLSKKVLFLYSKLKKLFEADGNEKSFLVFFRLSISSVAIIELASLIRDLPLFFSSSRTLIPQELIYIESGYFRYLHPLYQFVEKNGLSEIFYPTVVTIYIIALILLLTGLFTRYAAGTALLLQLIIFRSFTPFNYGYDYFLTMSLFYCVIFPVGYFFSIDQKVFKLSLRCDFNYRRVLQIHLAMAYCFSGIAKGLDAGWWNGNSVWKALASADNSYYAFPSEILIVIGIGTVLLEFLYPFLVLKKVTRKYAITAIILMHAGIAITMNLYAFSIMMIVWNIAAYGRLTTKKIITHAKTA